MARREEKWEKIIEFKDKVAKKLETAREQKIIGHSLNAKVILYANQENYNFLKQIEEELLNVFIVSEVVIEKKDIETGIEIEVEQAEGEKCERCWMYSKTVGKNEHHPTICSRCAKNLE